MDPKAAIELLDTQVFFGVREFSVVLLEISWNSYPFSSSKPKDNSLPIICYKSCVFPY